MSFLVRCLIPSLLLAWFLVGCGYKGNITLPDNKAGQKEHTSQKELPSTALPH